MFWPVIRQKLQWRYAKHVALGLGVALVLYSLLGFFLVPWIIGNQIRSQAKTRLHREARVDEVRFNPFTLAATIKGFTLLDRDGASLLAFDRLYIDLQLSGLVRRALRFREFRLDHPVLSVRILADGRPSVADLIASAPDAPDPAPFQLPRLIVDVLTVNGGVAQFNDASLQPPYERLFDPLNIHVHNLVTIPEEGGEHTISIGVEDGAMLRWSGKQTVDPLHLAGQIDIKGLSLHRLWDYLGQGQPLDVYDGRVDVTLPYEVHRGPDGRIRANLQEGSASIRALAARPRGQTVDWLTVPELRVEKVSAAWPEARLNVGSVRVSRPRALALILQDGALNWSQVLKRDTPLPAAGQSSPQWQFHIESAEIDSGSIGFESPFVKPPVKVELADFAARAEGISNDLAASVPLTVKARIQEKGALEASGRIAWSPLIADLKFNARGIDLAPWRAYVGNASGVPVNKGMAGFEGQLTVAGDKPIIKVSAAATLENVELQGPDGDRLVAWQKVEIAGVTVENPPGRARVRKITVDGPFAKTLIDPNGHLNLTKLTSGASTPNGTPANSTLPFTVEVGTVELRSATAEFADESLLLPFRARIHRRGGTIRDLSSFASAPATLAIEGRVDETGYVKTDGTLRVANPMASSEVNVSFRSIDMVELTPYFAQFAGYAVKSGVIDLDVRYVVKDSRLIGNHILTARDLVLGEKVKDSKAPGLPIRLAVALLKDKEGRINMDVPIEGDVNSPEFNYRAVFWTAVRTILGNVAKAPFRAIGRLFGRDEDDLDLVEFDLGRSDLLPAEADKLTRITEQIGPRRELTLAIEGRFEQLGDQAALKQAKLDRLIESRRESVEAAAAATGAPALDTILDVLFTEQFSAEALQAERQRFTSQPGAPPAFDAAAFYESRRAQLLEAQQITDMDLISLAAARAQTIAGILTGSGAIEPSRVSVTPPSAAKRKKTGSARVSSEITMSVEGDAADK